RPCPPRLGGQPFRRRSAPRPRALRHHGGRGPADVASRHGGPPSARARMRGLAVPGRDRPRAGLRRRAPCAVPPATERADIVTNASPLRDSNGRRARVAPARGDRRVTPGALRVLQVHNRYRQLGGEDSVAATEASLLRDAGHAVIEHHVSNPSGGGAAAASLAAAPWNRASAREMRRAVRECEPDVAHVHNTWYTLSPSVLDALSGTGVPVVMTLHNYRLVCANAQLFRDARPCRH